MRSGLFLFAALGCLLATPLADGCRACGRENQRRYLEKLARAAT